VVRAWTPRGEPTTASDEKAKLARGVTTERPVIIENYHGYVPPLDVTGAVLRLMEAVPSHRLAGIHSVVLTNQASLSQKRRKSKILTRNRRIRIAEVSGLYHARYRDEPAWIEIFVDEALKAWESGWLLTRTIRHDLALGRVLYHEVGHHIYATLRPKSDPEVFADRWRDNLLADYVRHSYGWMAFIAAPVNVVRLIYRGVSRLLQRKN
jgi:hypothetical protein